MKSKRGKKSVQGKEKNMNRMRKIRVLYSDPYATDYSSEDEDLFLRNKYQLGGSKRIVQEIFVPFLPLAYENKKNASEDVREMLLLQTSPSSVLDVTVTVTATEPAKDINDINDSVKENNVEELTSDGKRGDVVERVCSTENISFQYLAEETDVASLVGYDLYFVDEMEMLLGDGFCNLFDNDIDCGSMWKVEDDEGSSILPHIDCDFNDPELDWIDETPNWHCH